MKNGLELVTLGVALSAVDRNVREEGGNNTGPEIRRYQLNAEPPIHEAVPWCALAFQFYSDVAARGIGVDNPLDAVRLEAYVQDYYDTLRGYEVSPGGIVLRGFLVLYSFGGERWDHMGLVSRPPAIGSSLFEAVEGNTSPGVGADEAEREREGDVVARKTRQLDANYRVTFIDWTEAGESE